MSDPNTEEITQTPEETNGKEQEPKKPTEGGTLRKKLEEALAKLSEYQTKEAQLLEEEAKKRGDFESLIKQKEEKITELENRYKEAVVTSNLTQAFSRVKDEFKDLIMEKGKHLVTFDENGQVSNIDSIVEELSEKYPSAFSTKTTATMASVPTVSSQNSNNRMDIAEYKKLSFDQRARVKAEGRQPLGM
jgi:hypothetical protein